MFNRIGDYLVKFYSFVDECSGVIVLSFPIILFYCFYKLFVYHTESYIYGSSSIENGYVYYVPIIFVNFIFATLFANNIIENRNKRLGSILLLSFIFTVFFVFFRIQLTSACVDKVISASSIKTCTNITNITNKPACVYYSYNVNGKIYKSSSEAGKNIKKLKIGDAIIVEYSEKYQHLSRVIDFFPNQK